MKYSSNIRSLIAAVPLLLGAHSASLLAAGDCAGSVSVSDPYVRAVPPGQPNSAAFMTLRNGGSADQSIVSAESDLANIVELHTHVHQGGMMKMRQVDKIDIPAQGETVLQPGGLHVMLIDLKRELEPGTQIDITLVYADGSRQQVKAPVKKMQMMMNEQMKH